MKFKVDCHYGVSDVKDDYFVIDCLPDDVYRQVAEHLSGFSDVIDSEEPLRIFLDDVDVPDSIDVWHNDCPYESITITPYSEPSDITHDVLIALEDIIGELEKRATEKLEAREKRELERLKKKYEK